MTYRVLMIVRNPPDSALRVHDQPTRLVATQFAGCADEEEAKQKARAIYDVEVFKKVEAV